MKNRKKIMVVLAVTLLLVLCFPGTAAAKGPRIFEPEISWQTMIGGNDSDLISSMQQTSDGGFIIAGYSRSTDITGVENHGDYDCYIIKLSSDKQVEWQKMLGGNSDEGFALSGTLCLQQTEDDGYVIGCSSSSTDINGVPNHGCLDYYIIKLDNFGEIEWQRLIGGSRYEFLTTLQQAADGGYVIGGHSGSLDISGISSNGQYDNYIVKLDSEGNLEWQRMYGGSGVEETNCIHQTLDGGYIIGGSSQSTNINGLINYGSADYYILKLNTAGNLEWQKVFGGNGWDQAESIQQTADDGFIIGGFSKSTDIDGLINHGASDSYIVKLSNLGTLEWQIMLGGNTYETLIDLQQTNDEGYVLGGYTRSTDIEGVPSHGDFDWYIAKLDSEGSLEWLKMIGGENVDELTTIQQTLEGDYILGGHSHSDYLDDLVNNGGYDYYIVKLNDAGALVWQKMIGGNMHDHLMKILQTLDNKYILGGSSSSNDIVGIINHGDCDYYIVQLETLRGNKGRK